MKKNLQDYKRRKLFFYCFLFVFFVLAFAVLYYLLFISNTASFYISEEYNEKVNGRYVYHSPEVLYDIVDRSVNPFSIDDFNQKIKLINDSLLRVYEKIDSLHTYNDDLERRREEQSMRLMDSRTEDIERYRNDQLSSLRDSITAYEQSLEESLRFGITEDQLVLNGSYVRLANMNYRLAQKNLQVSTTIVDNFGSFGNRELADSLQNTVSAYLETCSHIRACEDIKRELFNTYSNMLDEFHRQRLDKLCFIDFIHFSLLIATSNSFGDILPNSSLSRIFVSLQLLVGIVLVAFIVDYLVRKK